MTTEPKFIPEEGVKIQLDDNAVMNVRLIDCVGYIVPSSIGYIENEAPRMVVTPWFENEVPFNMAAEVGTQKVITEHSTIGLVITTDGSISDIPRSEYLLSFCLTVSIRTLLHLKRSQKVCRKNTAFLSWQSVVLI